MTLATRPKPPVHHKKVSGKHHRQNKTYHKPYWPYLPMLAIVAAGLLLNMVWSPRHGVLGYSTDVSAQTLVVDTNNDRADNGLSGVTLNSLLVQAAQAKANDMVARDYWSHNTPDGQAPWSFITATGYSYQTAGENLAYGFTTAADTETAWMNSPEHKANILNNTYTEVGFGIANGANYQGSGQETVIVAMFAKPVARGATPVSPVAAAPTTTTPTASGQASGQSAAGGDTATNVQPATSTDPTTAPTISTTTSPDTESSSGSETVNLEPKPQTVNRMQVLTAGKLPATSLALTLIVVAGMLLLITRHSLAWHKVLRRGEKFVLKHRFLDIAVLSLVALSFILSRSSGLIR